VSGFAFNSDIAGGVLHGATDVCEAIAAFAEQGAQCRYCDIGFGCADVRLSMLL